MKKNQLLAHAMVLNSCGLFPGMPTTNNKEAIEYTFWQGYQFRPHSTGLSHYTLQQVQAYVSKESPNPRRHRKVQHSLISRPTL